MALTLEEEKALLALLHEKRTTLPELTAATEINNDDLFLTSQMLADKSVTAGVVKQFIAPDATLTRKGITQLSNRIDSNSETEAATPKAIKQIYELLTKAVENGVKSAQEQMRKTLYIDNINGNDDNDGITLASPLKTFVKAAKLVPAGSSIELRLLANYTFGKDESIPFFHGCNLLVRSYHVNSPVTIKFSYYIPDDYPNQFMMRSFQFYNFGNIEFYSINLELPEIPSEHQSGKTYPHGASVIRSNSSSMVTTQLGVRLSKVNIYVPEPDRSEWHFIGNPSGMTDLILDGVTFPDVWRDRNKMFFKGRLSDTAFHKRTVNTTKALSTNNTVYNDGKVI